MMDIGEILGKRKRDNDEQGGSMAPYARGHDVVFHKPTAGRTQELEQHEVNEIVDKLGSVNTYFFYFINFFECLFCGFIFDPH
jgi:hypothetical protein